MNNALALNNEFFTEDQKRLIKDMYFKQATEEEFKMFCYIAQRTKLDPVLKQIYPVKRWDSNLKKEVMTCQTSIDGYRIIAERTCRYAPGREPTFQYDAKGELISSTAYVKKMTDDGSWHEIGATAYYKEYVQKKKDGTITSFWQNMPHGQTAKCAEALALRKAFPYDLGSIRTDDEMQVADYEVINKKEEKIAPNQIEELFNMLEQCSKETVSKFMKFIKNSPINADRLEDIPVSQYENLHKMLMQRYTEAMVRKPPEEKFVDTSFNPDEFQGEEIAL